MAGNHKEIRAAIVDAARDIFSQYGYKKTTLDDIASSLHRVKSSLYYYFRNKEDLFKAVVEYEAARASRITHAAVDRETTPEAKLRAYFTTMLVFIDETMNYYKLIREEMVDVLSFAEEAKKSHEQETLRFMRYILNEGVEDGSFTITHIEGAVAALKYMFDALINPYPGERKLTPEELNALLDILFNGIKTR